MESLTYIPKRTHLNDIICNVVVICCTPNTYQRNRLRSIHCIMLDCNYNLAEMSSTKRISLLMQNKLKNEKIISISNQLT